MTEWGPWIEHDGKGCPCVGQYVQAERTTFKIDECIAGADAIRDYGSANVCGSAWVWIKHPDLNNDWFIRYRIRKPLGMVILEAILADLPAPVESPVTA